MSPIRDVEDRSLRRMELDGVRERDREAKRLEAEAARQHAATPERPAPAIPDGVAENEDDYDRLPKREKHGGRRSEAVSRRVGRLHVAAAAGLPVAAGAAAPEPASILAVTRGQCEVELASGEVAVAHLPKTLALQQQSEIAVGDRVLLERRPTGALAVARLLPRSSRLSRPDPFYAHRERVLVANLDLAVIVASLRRPPLSPGLIDRFLVALAHGGVPAAIAVNKIDLAAEPRPSDAELGLIEPYRALDLPLVLCSARTGEGLDELRTLLAGRTAVLVGHSGAGKSSLLNALAPAAQAEVGEVSDSHRRGRHTTTRARVYRIGAGTRLVDTPGIRKFGLWKMTPRELAAYFDELVALAPGCRFADCTHVHEPRCAVRAADERGELPRYATYRRILDSLDAG